MRVGCTNTARMTDPFEFQVNYGPVFQSTLTQIYRRVIPRELTYSRLTLSEVAILMFARGIDPINDVGSYREKLEKEGEIEDKAHGPTLRALVSPISSDIKGKLIKLVGEEEGLALFNAFQGFISKFGSAKAFLFMRNCPPFLLFIDKVLRDKEINQSQQFNLPILSSSGRLLGKNATELKRDLLEALFTPYYLESTFPAREFDGALARVKEGALIPYLGERASNEVLQLFRTGAGQLLFYFLYQALNLELISILNLDQINQVKELFANTIGDFHYRASIFEMRAREENLDVLFTQESTQYDANALVGKEKYLPIEGQNPNDGCFIFLKEETWEPDYGVIEHTYPNKAKLNLILAQTKETKEHFLLASCHGHSTNAADARAQIAAVMEKFHELSGLIGGLQLIIGIDANTKEAEDIAAFKKLATDEGLVLSDVGPTTHKKRKVTVQHRKSEEPILAPGDGVLMLAPEQGGHYVMAEAKLAIDPDLLLPTIDYPADHNRVLVTAIKIDP